MQLINNYCSSFRQNEEVYNKQAKEVGANSDTVIARAIFAKSVIDFLNTKFNLALAYDSVYVPKYFNYTRAVTYFNYNDSDFNLLLDAISYYGLLDELEDNIKLYTNSRDSYLSFCNEDELKAEKGLHIKVILETLFNSEDVQDEFEQYYKNIYKNACK